MSADRGPLSELGRDEGRSLFGLDPEGYEAGRPDYPGWVYDRLVEPGGLRPGVRVVEVGPGTGLVTRGLLAAGAEVVAIEPDPSLARHLVNRFQSDGLSVINASFEEANLADASADLLVAATAFHWVDQARGMAVIRRVLRPGGWVALWWTLFFDRSKPDLFLEATGALFPKVPAEFAEPGRPEFQLDREHRCRDLAELAGVVDVSSEIDPWDVVLNSRELVALYASMAVIRRQPIAEQQRILRAIETTAIQDFGGAVTRHFVTALYMGRSP